jgi:nitroreductase
MLMPLPSEARVIDNAILTAIRERRSAGRFTSQPITDAQLAAILEAGRWAPSALNSQPWNFVVVTDLATRNEIGTILKEVSLGWFGFAAAPVMIVISVDPSRDPRHYVEDGAVAVQNICLAAHSVGLASSWAGVYESGTRKGTPEKALQKLLSLPRTHRIIAVVPIGTAAPVGQSQRRPLNEVVHRNRFSPMPQSDPEASTTRRS